jgi:hypothetical protein
MKYWLKLLEIDERTSLGDAQGQQRKGEGSNWTSKIKHELKSVGKGGIWMN